MSTARRVVEIKAPQRSQLVFRVAKDLRDAERLGERRPISGCLGSSDAPSAACSFISRADPGSLRCRERKRLFARLRHSSTIDNCIQRGIAAAVSATPIDSSPPGENAQSSAARKLSISRA